MTAAPHRFAQRLAALAGAVLALGGGFMLLLVFLTPPSGTAVTAVVVLLLVVAPVLLGIWLMHRAAPSGLAIARGAASSLLSTAFWRTVPGRIAAVFSYPHLAASPIRRAALGGLIAAVVFAIAPRGARWVGILAAFTLYSFADPAINAFRSRWWLNTAKSVAGFLLLFAVAAIASDLDDVGEAGMVFVLPLMIYPFAVGISGVIRLLWFHRPAA